MNVKTPFCGFRFFEHNRSANTLERFSLPANQRPHRSRSVRYSRPSWMQVPNGNRLTSKWPWGVSWKDSPANAGVGEVCQVWPCYSSQRRPAVNQKSGARNAGGVEMETELVTIPAEPTVEAIVADAELSARLYSSEPLDLVAALDLAPELAGRFGHLSPRWPRHRSPHSRGVAADHCGDPGRARARRQPTHPTRHRPWSLAHLAANHQRQFAAAV